MPESYYPDNKPVIYAILPESVSFTQPPQEENGLALTMEIMMSDNAKDMMVVHSAQNLVKDSMLEGLSGCTMLRPGGTLVILRIQPRKAHIFPTEAMPFGPIPESATAGSILGKNISLFGRIPLFLILSVWAPTTIPTGPPT